MPELPDSTHARIVALCGEGDALAKEEAYPAAIARYEEAWSLLSEPRMQWEAALWIQAAIADARFLAGEYPRALESSKLALLCGGIGNPFVHLRRGQCLLEVGRRDEAIQELTRAYAGGGRELFDGEDPKYLAVLRGVLRPTEGEGDL